jgi:hypothetical protein
MLSPSHFITRQLAILCAALLIPGSPPMPAQNQAQPQAPATQKLSAAQLESLVAPIALYPDDLLAQVLVASTYPLEIVEADRWLKQNSSLKGEGLVNAAKQQNWDPSVQALVVFPDILNRMNANVRWTADLGNAFLAQQNDVMEAVQNLRAKAQQQGKLQSTEQQKVVTRQVDDQTVIEVEPANPQVVYVPQYNPEAVWGASAYPYPAMSYPAYPAYSTGGVVAASLLSFGTGIAIGAIFSGGYGNWGWDAHWGGGSFNSVDVNNNFFRQNNFKNANYNRVGAGTQAWQHNPAHRQGVPYANRQVANEFGRQSGNQALRNPAAVSNRLQQGGMQRPQGGQGMQGARPGAGGQQAGVRRPQGPGGAGMQGARPGGAGQLGGQQRLQGQAGGQRANAAAQRAGGGGAFAGTDRGSRVQADSARGRSSMGRGGGGGRGVGGGGGGGRRGGGGGRRR